MKVTTETVDYVAALARLSFHGDEKEKMAAQLQGILSYMEKLDALDTEAVKPLEHLENAVNVFREDEVRDSFPREEILRNAPRRDTRAFKVPGIME
ncbi:MAG: Asp-tRNA(Asn)/Glu-tRNA(Gln) amidotransferase subunit GatC [Clostridia bacterium]